MDNLTHSLIGIVIGRFDAGAQSHSKAKAHTKDHRAQTAALWTGVIGSNLPDLDFLLGTFGGGENLSYLLQHRGYTHTLLLSIPIAMLAAVLGTFIARPKEPEKKKLFVIGWVAVLMHIVMDWQNSYGVHPFSPFANSWFYGDTFFIIEPLLWGCLLPFVFATSRSALGRGFSLGFSAFFIAALGLIVFASKIMGFSGISWPIVSGVTLWTAFFFWIHLKFKQLRIAGIPAMGLMVLIIVFSMGSRIAHYRVRDVLLSQDSLTQIRQISVSPAPSNPFCWLFTTLEYENREFYVARTGVLSLLPEFFPPHRCHLFLAHAPGSQGLPPGMSAVNWIIPGVFWIGEFKKPLAEFDSWKNKSCRFDAFLRFSRIPFWWNAQAGSETSERWVASDLRFLSRGDKSFSQLDLNSHLDCPQEVPPWNPPTQSIRY